MVSVKGLAGLLSPVLQKQSPLLLDFMVNLIALVMIRVFVKNVLIYLCYSSLKGRSLSDKHLNVDNAEHMNGQMIYPISVTHYFPPLSLDRISQGQIFNGNKVL